MSDKGYFTLRVPKCSINKFDYLSNDVKKLIIDVVSDMLTSLITLEYSKYIDDTNLSLNALTLPYMLKEKQNG